MSAKSAAHRTFIVLVLLAALGVLRTPVSAVDAGEHLGAAIPEDVHVYSWWKNSPEQAFLLDQYRAACKKLAASGIVDDFLDLALVEGPEGKKNEDEVEAVRNLLESVGNLPWEEMFAKEVAVGFRFGIPVPELVILVRVEEDAAPKHVEAFRKFFNDVVSLSGPALAVTDSKVGDHDVLSLSVAQAPIGIDVATHGDVLLVGLSRALLTSSLELAAGKTTPGKPGAILSSERYRKVTAGLRAERHAETIVDLAGYLGVYKDALGFARQGAGDDPTANALIDLASDVLTELQLLGTVVEIDWAEENRLRAENRLILAEGYRESALWRVVGNRKPLENIQRIVPADATGLCFSSGIDNAALHDLIRETIRNRIPGGERALEEFKKFQDHIGFHLRDDLIAWLEGSWGWMSFPGKGPCDDHVVVVRLSDQELAKQKIRAGFERLVAFLEKRGQKLTAEAGEDLPEGFRVVRFDAFPDCSPVIGFPGELLVLATSPDAVRKVRATFSGELDHFTGGEDFDLREILPIGDPYLAQYADVENQLRDLAQLLTGAGFFLSILPRDEDTKQAIKVGAILTKLGTFVRDIDLGLKTASWVGFDQEKGWLTTHWVMSFKTPAGGAKKVETQEREKSERL